LEEWEVMKAMVGTLLILLLSGCTTTNQAMLRVNNSFAGKNIDEFVLQHGVPYKKHQLNSGDFIYVWNSGVISYQMPATTNLSGTVSPYGYTGTATTYGGGALNVFCEVQIHTAQDGMIRSIQAVRDTIGKWTLSRCSELF